jgi:hypothetical protein
MIFFFVNGPELIIFIITTIVGVGYM